MKNVSDREEWLDIVRSIAIFVVLVVHALENKYSISMEGQHAVFQKSI